MMENDAEVWHAQIFDTPQQLSSFLNHLKVRPEQLVQVQLQSLASNQRHLLFVGRLSAAQVRSIGEWESVERIHNPDAVPVATGGH
jgi:hypothetical protein